MKAETLFALDDKFIKSNGLYALWMGIFTTIMTVLLYDDTNDASRQFATLVIGISCIYPCVMTTNIIYGNGLASTFILIGCSFHQFLFWILFAHFQPSNVLGSHPIGVMNWVWCGITVPFTLGIIVKTWWLLFNKEQYKEYTTKGHVAVNQEDPASSPASVPVGSEDIVVG